MSGGHFDYGQFNAEDIAEEIERVIRDNKTPNEWGGCWDFGPDVLEKFSEACITIRKAGNMIHAIDWLLSGDDSEGTFTELWERKIQDK